MSADQLKKTTMDPKNRTLYRVMIASDSMPTSEKLVDEIMGKNPEFRLKFIKEGTNNLTSKLDDILLV
jgi:topoisomerase-4 subunit B